MGCALQCPRHGARGIPVEYRIALATAGRRSYLTRSQEECARSPVPRLVHIVDDDAQVRAATSYLLGSHGYETRLYAGGAELLEAPLAEGCVLLDLRMPDMGGDEVQQALAQRGIELPVIVMSGHGDLAAAVRAMKLGAVDFLQKPPHEEDLLAAVARALEQHEQGQSRRQARQEAAQAVERLSRRERQILQGLLAGLSNKAIARRLGISLHTVKFHVESLFRKLGARTRTEALAKASERRVEL
jgi:two-component system response regulator FixJ